MVDQHNIVEMIGHSTDNGVKGLFDKVCTVMSWNNDRGLAFWWPVIPDTVNARGGRDADTGIVEAQCSELVNDGAYGCPEFSRVLETLSSPDKDVGDMNH